MPKNNYIVHDLVTKLSVVTLRSLLQKDHGTFFNLSPITDIIKTINKKKIY